MKEKIEQLTKELNQHNYNYYILDNPTITDFEFDEKLKELQDLENNILSGRIPILLRRGSVEELLKIFQRYNISLGCILLITLTISMT